VLDCRVEPALFANGADNSFVGLPCGGYPPGRSVREGMCETPAEDIGQGHICRRCVDCLEEERLGQEKGWNGGTGIIGKIGEDPAEGRVDFDGKEEAEEAALGNREVEEFDEVFPKGSASSAWSASSEVVSNSREAGSVMKRLNRSARRSEWLRMRFTSSGVMARP